MVTTRGAGLSSILRFPDVRLEDVLDRLGDTTFWSCAGMTTDDGEPQPCSITDTVRCPDGTFCDLVVEDAVADVATVGTVGTVGTVAAVADAAAVAAAVVVEAAVALAATVTDADEDEDDVTLAVSLLAREVRAVS